MKSQSSMEYLMTYGWAILIIVVSLLILATFGVFDPQTYAAKAPPGACSVNRPQGPGTTTNMQLSGLCSGEIPQFTTSFTAPGTCSAAIFPVRISQMIQLQSTPLTASAITITWWANAASNVGAYFHLNSANPLGGIFCYPSTSGSSPQLACQVYPSAPFGSVTASQPISNNQWTFYALTTNGAGSNLYVNGVGASSGVTLAAGTTFTDFDIFGYQAAAGPAPAPGCMNGQLADVQLYTTTLSSNSIQSLYIEGIGGVPTDLQDIAGWWPLNGNTNDYSGNNNNGVYNSISYNGHWWTGYTTP